MQFDYVKMDDIEIYDNHANQNKISVLPLYINVGIKTPKNVQRKDSCKASCVFK